LLEQSRHQATELTNATRAEVEQTLEWARAQASAIIARAQQGTEQLLAAAGLGEARANEVAAEIVKSAETAANSQRAGEQEPSEPEAGAGPQRIGPAPEASTPAAPPPSPESETGPSPSGENDDAS
jgi:hypothetical protein